MELFISHQYPDDFNEAFVMAAMSECMRNLPENDFFKMAEYEEFNDAMMAYLMC